MSSKLEIINSALATVGDSPITAEELAGGQDGLGSQPRARAINTVWQDAFEEWLAAYPWGFVKTRADLDPLTTPLFEWAEAFTLPSDFLTMIALNESTNCVAGRDYEIENGMFLTDESSAQIEYIYIPSESSVDLALTRANPIFRAPLVTLLAAKAATKIKDDGGAKMLTLLNVYERQLSVAIVKAASESKQAQRFPASESPALRSRWQFMGR